MASSSNEATLVAGAACAVPATGLRPAAIIGATGGIVGAATMVAGRFLHLRPNRVVDGVAQSGVEAFGAVGWALLAGWLLLGLLALAPPTRQVALVRGLGGSALVLASLWMSGVVAAEFAAAQGQIARTSFGWSFYLSLLALYLVHFAAMEESGTTLARGAIIWSAMLGVAALAATGALSELGIVREFVLTRDVFARELRVHLFYAAGATVAAIVIGVPLGILSVRSRRVEGPAMGLLNLGQVFPALAFVGLMIPVFGSLGRNVPALKALGVAGIGWAPVFVVLLVYALFPVVRNTIVAIRTLDTAVLDAAKGMGMGHWRTLAEVELPLGFPIVLAGVRVALVQSTAGAVIAAFVGGGGLGTIMFFGLEQTSMDLVLVGVVPIVALALAFDTGLRAIERLTGGTGGEVT